MIHFRVYGIPQTKGSMRAFIPPGARFPILTNANKNNKAWELLVREEAGKHRPPALLLGPIRLSLTFHMKKPKSLPKRKPALPIKKPDLSKMFRSVEDALTGVIYRDDAQIVQGYAEKIYSDAPGVEVRVLLAVMLPVNQNIPQS